MESYTDAIVEKTESHFFPEFSRNPLIVVKVSGYLVKEFDEREYIGLT